MTHLTLQQQTNAAGFPKPGELIEITGAHELEASDRAIFNLLYQHAHDSGRLGERDAEWRVPLAQLRASKHESNDRIRESLTRLLRVVVKVPFTDATGEPRTLLTHLFDFFEMPAGDGGGGGAMVRFGLPRELQPILARSARWGRIKAEVVCAMTSKYAIALYEIIQLRANMDRCIETFPIDRFRALMGVPPGTYERGANFTKRVLEPAALEVNGLSDMGVQTEIVRRNAVSPIEGVTVTWWRKEGDAFRETQQERNRSKAGRSARLRGKVETMRPVPALSGAAG